jgi:hypothetical protein
MRGPCGSDLRCAARAGATCDARPVRARLAMRGPCWRGLRFGPSWRTCDARVPAGPALCYLSACACAFTRLFFEMLRSPRRGGGVVGRGRAARPRAAGSGAKRHAGIKLISFQYDQCRAEGRGNVRQARPRHGRSGPIPPAQRRGEGAAPGVVNAERGREARGRAGDRASRAA